MPAPLAHLRVLDLTDLKGQFAGRLLADMGMRVIKVEPPGGDSVRRLGPFEGDRVRLDGSLRFAFLNGGKQSIGLDLDSAEGQALLRRRWMRSCPGPMVCGVCKPAISRCTCCTSSWRWWRCWWG